MIDATLFTNTRENLDLAEPNWVSFTIGVFSIAHLIERLILLDLLVFAIPSAS